MYDQLSYLFLKYLPAALFPHNTHCGRDRVRIQAFPRDHGHRYRRCQSETALGIDDMRIAHPSDCVGLLRVAGSGNGAVAEHDLFAGRLEANSPTARPRRSIARDDIAT